jgi:2-keto-4-pentenoate hydratase/2-oxohepta-3-ene-1,7-dioic acid hydratase in catechol pathway
MRLGRVQRVGLNGLNGEEARIVLVDLDADRLIDVRASEETRLRQAGNSPEAARRLAEARFPRSLSDALGSLDFCDFVTATLSSPAPDHAVIPFTGAHWLPAIDPPRYRDFMSFEQHHLTVRHVLGRAVPDVTYELPTYYKGAHHTLVGHDQCVTCPPYCRWLDFELELGFVLGRGGCDLTPDEASECLFGVTLLNDLSARDRQFHETQGNLGPAKGKDFATAVGPWITTVDEVDLAAIDLTAKVNGELWCDATSGSAMWTASELVAYLSTAEPLVAGELIGSGTVGGGCGLEIGRQIVPGDVIELAGSGLGCLRTTIEEPGPLRWSPARRDPGKTIDGTGIRGLAPALPPRADAPAPPVDRERSVSDCACNGGRDPLSRQVRHEPGCLYRAGRPSTRKTPSLDMGVAY